MFQISSFKNMDCIFCKIIKGEIPTEFLYKDSDVVAFRDIHPIAPVHVLVIPVEHIPSVADLQDKDTKLVGKLIMIAKKIAEDLNIAQDGYKLLFRVKKHGGQEIDHIHLHLIGGAQLSEDIRPVS